MRTETEGALSTAIRYGRAADLLPGLLPAGRVVAVADAAVVGMHPGLTEPYETVAVATGEEWKTLAAVEALHREFIRRGVDRRTYVLGVGGGILTDVAGFAASTYMRGLAFGFVPTTLLGQVDAAIGGKNGVNVGGYKNMAGLFAAPRFVVIDPSLLATLPLREFRAGLAETAKAALIGDAALFERLEGCDFEALQRDEDALREVVAAAVSVKTAIVGRDACERGERRKLNLGHTLAHAIEQRSPKLNHGEAVAVGMALASDAAVRLGVLDARDRDRIAALLRRMGFDLRPPVPLDEALAEVDKDKKREGGVLHAVLPTRIGACEVRPMSVEAFRELFR